MFGCPGSSLLRTGFAASRDCSSLSARASHYRGFSRWGAQALATQSSVVAVLALSNCGLPTLECGLQQLWWTRFVAPGHVGSSWTRDRACVPYMGRRISIHCTTREVLWASFFELKKFINVTNILHVKYISAAFVNTSLPLVWLRVPTVCGCDIPLFECTLIYFTSPQVNI